MSKVEDLGQTFQNCSALVTVDLSAFNTQSEFKTNSMFNGCTRLTTIYATEPTSANGNYGFDKSKLTKDSSAMFASCNVLDGHNGTTFSAKKSTDKTFALVDRPGQEGYFTQKSGN